MAKKILLVEDDPVSRKFMELILAKEGFQIITASNGLEGLRKAKQESPDLLILDVMLPGLDGFEVCHRLRDDEYSAHLPVLVLSAKSQESDKNAALSVGANDFLAKPVDRLVLIAKVTELLAPAAAAAPPASTNGKNNVSQV
jgi:DNA-binding response OmpR family regulator